MSVEKMITDHIDIWSSALQTRSTAGRGSNGKIDLYGIKKLRELILELAVRGKLVPQDPNDEPASELLKRIAAEKAELVNQGKIKKQKSLPEISEEEKPFKLPEGWEWVRLGDISSPIAGFAFKASGFNEVGKGLPLIRIRDVGQRFSATFYDGDYRAEFLVYPGDYLISMDGIFRVASWEGDIALLNQRVTKLAFFNNEIVEQFICGSLQKRLHELQGVKAYTTVDHLSGGQIASSLIAFPPKKEQVRIVKKINELLFLCEQLEQQSLTSLDVHQQLVETLLATLTDSQNAEDLAENWARISQHFDTLFTTEASIDALKQTILQLAVMGKLVPQDPNDEPASELLKRIEQEKVQLVKEGKIKRHSPVEPLGEPTVLPRSWLNIVVQDFADIRLGSTPNRSEKKYWNGDIPWVSSGEVANEVILDTREKITSDGFKNSSTSMIPAGSLLMAIIGQGKTRGQTAILGIDACTNQNVAAFVFNRVFVDPEFVWIWAKSKYFSHRGDGHGGAQPALNGKKVRSFIFPLAPIKEQRRIVSEVKRLNDTCDTLKSRLQSAQQTQLHLADALTDAALN
ncbi:restriction endonuclease subunit S [Serratia marcescens]|nr:restriction endonuclease subunit S [Serratia marcescens]